MYIVRDCWKGPEAQKIAAGLVLTWPETYIYMSLRILSLDSPRLLYHFCFSSVVLFGSGVRNVMKSPSHTIF